MTSSSHGRLRKDIQVIQPNPFNGHDKIIGDIHGAASPFHHVLAAHYAPNDRLFIVGDLTDRGEDSFSVIKEIVAFQQQNPDRLFMVRGNHEDACLASIIQFETLVLKTLTSAISTDTLADDLHVKLRTYFHKIQEIPGYCCDDTDAPFWELNHILFQIRMGHGDWWLVTIYMQELKLNYFSRSDSGELIYHPDSKIKMIKELFEQLPYIIHVQGPRPFNIVHADMPFSDAELFIRIQENRVVLSQSEIDYAIHSRIKNADTLIRDTGRTASSITTYVGHSIVLWDVEAEVVRADSNTINLDVAAYYYGGFLLLNHTDLTCEYTGDISAYPTLKPALDSINFKLLIEYLKIYNRVSTLENKIDAPVEAPSFFSSISSKQMILLGAFSLFATAVVLKKVFPDASDNLEKESSKSTCALQ